MRAAGGPPTPVAVRLVNSGLAAQATAPPLSDSEVSCGANDINRAFPHIARKLLPRPALENQRVHPDDSVLGPFRDADGLGLTKTFSQLIQETFAAAWWDAPGWTTCGQGTERTALPRGDNLDGEECFDLMEANFTLYWGLAIQAYERTLLSGQSRFDAFVRGSRRQRFFASPDGSRTARPPPLRNRRRMRPMPFRRVPYVGIGGPYRTRRGYPPRDDGLFGNPGARPGGRGVLQYRGATPR